jgi:DNA-binding response OmpR family regulator
VAIAILALEKDLFFSVKIRDTLLHYDMDVTTVRTLASLEQGLAATGDAKPALVIVDIASKNIDWEAAIRTVRTHGVPVLAFGSHMDLDARARALQAGAQKVVANSKFSKDMPGLVQRMLNSSAEDASVDASDDRDDEEEE